MKLKFSLLTVAGALLAGLALVIGCSQVPFAPERSVALSVTLNPKDNVKAALLGVVQNEIYYRVDGTGEGNPHSVAGPFSMPVSDGAVSFTVRVPQGTGPQLLSLQLNDASTHQPLAIGATTFDFGVGLEGGLVVDMGSVTRTCYYVNTDNPPSGSSNLYNKGYNFYFEGDLVNPTAPTNPSDIVVAQCAACSIPSAFYFQGFPAGVPAAPATNIAYLGKGDLVDFDSVPPASAFFNSSMTAKGGPATLEAGDVYCIQLLSPTGAHAWVQVTDSGSPNVYGPAFIYRVNSTQPYYGYERTAADNLNLCVSY